MSAVYDLPGKRLSNAFARTLAGGWQMTGILTLQSGRPFTVFSGRDESNTGGGSDRPNVIGDWRVASPNADRWFNAQASSSAFSTVSRAAFQSQTGAQRQIQFALKYVF